MKKRYTKNEYFSDRLKCLLKKKGITYKRFYEMLDDDYISLDAIKSWVRPCDDGGYREPSINTLKKISETLDVSTDYLLGTTESESSKDVQSISDFVGLSPNAIKKLRDNEMKKEGLSSLLESESFTEVLKRLNDLKELKGNEKIKVRGFRELDYMDIRSLTLNELDEIIKNILTEDSQQKYIDEQIFTEEYIEEQMEVQREERLEFTKRNKKATKKNRGKNNGKN